MFSVPRIYENIPFTPIGEIIPRARGVNIIDRFGRVKPLKAVGFRHF